MDCYKEVQCKTKKPNCFKTDYITIRDRLSRVNWVTELRGGLATSYVNFFKILEDAMDGCVPEDNKKRKKKNMYLTPEATRKKDMKNKLWRRYKSTKCEYDRRRYITVKNELRSLTRNLRIKFENDIAQCIKSASKKFWSYVRSKTKTRSRIPTLKKQDGTEAATASDKTETLNKYFSSTFTDKLLEVIPSNTNNPFLGEYLHTFEITPQMILEKLQDLNPAKITKTRWLVPSITEKLSISYQHSSSYPNSEIFKRKPSTFSMVRGLYNSHTQERS